MKNLSDSILEFLFSLPSKLSLPEDVELMNPFLDEQSRKICREFYHKYYKGDRQRIAILGINPGRFGAGITGIPFTDPLRLESVCEISNPFPKKQELSSVFVYDIIHAYGGPRRFYDDFFISSVSPLGFTSHGKNLNYYDRRDLQNILEPFMVSTLREQIGFGLSRSCCICLGEGKNYKYLQFLNQKYSFFNEVIPLPHPRFIMQYRLKRKDEYITRYLDILNTCRNS